MIISTQEIIKAGSWIGREILRSIDPKDIIPGTSEYDIKILINGKEYEPKLLEDMLQNVEKYIDQEAEHVAKEKFEEARMKMFELDEVIQEAIDKIKTKFRLHDDDGD